MRMALTIILTILTFLTYGQGNNDQIQVIAKLISPGKGSKIQIAKYQVIKVVKGSIANKTIKVGYYLDNEYQDTQDTVLLNLSAYPGNKKQATIISFPTVMQKKE